MVGSTTEIRQFTVAHSAKNQPHSGKVSATHSELHSTTQHTAILFYYCMSREECDGSGFFVTKVFIYIPARIHLSPDPPCNMYHDIYPIGWPHAQLWYIYSLVYSAQCDRDVSEMMSSTDIKATRSSCTGSSNQWMLPAAGVRRPAEHSISSLAAGAGDEHDGERSGSMMKSASACIIGGRSNRRLQGGPASSCCRLPARWRPW